MTAEEVRSCEDCGGLVQQDHNCEKDCYACGGKDVEVYYQRINRWSGVFHKTCQDCGKKWQDEDDRSNEMYDESAGK